MDEYERLARLVLMRRFSTNPAGYEPEIHFHVLAIGDAFAYPELIISEMELAHTEWLNLNYLVWIYSGSQAQIMAVGDFHWVWSNGMIVKRWACRKDCLQHRSRDIFYLP